MIPKERICDAYRLGRFISASRARGSRNLCHVFYSSDGKWFVRRRHADYCDEKRIKFDHAAMFYLMNAGAPVNPPLASSAGNTWWHDGKNVWEVFEFIEGKNMRDGSKRDAAFLGTALGKFHHSGNGFKLRYEKISAYGETDPEQLLLNAEKLKATVLLHGCGPAASAFAARQSTASARRRPRTGNSMNFTTGRAAQPCAAGRAERTAQQGCCALPAHVLAPYEHLIEQTARDLTVEAYLALPHTLVHGDVQPANVIIGNHGVNAFVDFDWCAWRPRIYDLAFAILFCCSSHELPLGKGDIWALTQTPQFNAEALESFMNAYEKNAGALSEVERKYFGPQMALAWCHTRIDGAFKVFGEERHNFLSRPLPKDIFFPLSAYSTLNCEP